MIPCFHKDYLCLFFHSSYRSQQRKFIFTIGWINYDIPTTKAFQKDKTDV
uniref:Uncharacterized protein n=1 Tax=Anguilla anguilla TaxID=7936 RepID=A0A0E9TGU0_ANGAN